MKIEMPKSGELLLEVDGQLFEIHRNSSAEKRIYITKRESDTTTPKALEVCHKISQSTVILG